MVIDKVKPIDDLSSSRSNEENCVIIDDQINDEEE